MMQWIDLERKQKHSLDSLVLMIIAKRKKKANRAMKTTGSGKVKTGDSPSHIHSHAPDVRRTRSTFSITNCDIVHAWQAVLIFQRATKALDSMFFLFFFPERDAVGGHTQALIFEETGNLRRWASCEVSNICYLPSKKFLASHCQCAKRPFGHVQSKSHFHSAVVIRSLVIKTASSSTRAS